MSSAIFCAVLLACALSGTTFARDTRARERLRPTSWPRKWLKSLTPSAKVRVNQKDGITEEHGAMVERSRLMTEARKWLASKLAPKKYGLCRVATN